jgi:hypothetical protein
MFFIVVFVSNIFRILMVCSGFNLLRRILRLFTIFLFFLFLILTLYRFRFILNILRIYGLLNTKLIYNVATYSPYERINFSSQVTLYQELASLIKNCIIISHKASIPYQIGIRCLILFVLILLIVDNGAGLDRY